MMGTGQAQAHAHACTAVGVSSRCIRGLGPGRLGAFPRQQTTPDYGASSSSSSSVSVRDRFRCQTATSRHRPASVRPTFDLVKKQTPLNFTFGRQQSLHSLAAWSLGLFFVRSLARSLAYRLTSDGPFCFDAIAAGHCGDKGVDD